MLDQITKGRTRKPISMILHGTHGIGKSTFGTGAPNPIYVTGEEIEEVDASKFPKCNSWNQFVDQIKSLRDGDHDFKTLVIDTLDSIESLLWKHVLAEDGAVDMARAMGGYGKAYAYATQLFMNFRDDYLVPLRDKKGMNIILLCHTTKSKFEDPLTQSSYDVYAMKLHKNANPIFAEWVSIIAFASFEVYTVENKKSGKDYAVGEGERRMFCTPKPAYDAKNRFDLLEELPLEWSAIKNGVDSFFSNTKNPEAEELKNEIKALVEKIEDVTLKEQTIKNVQSVGDDVTRLEKAKQYLQGVV